MSSPAESRDPNVDDDEKSPVDELNENAPSENADQGQLTFASAPDLMPALSGPGDTSFFHRYYAIDPLAYCTNFGVQVPQPLPHKSEVAVGPREARTRRALLPLPPRLAPLPRREVGLPRYVVAHFGEFIAIISRGTACVIMIVID